jgi:cytochrome d ubiquinol oxidase subunit I
LVSASTLLAISALGIYIHAIFLSISLGFPWIILALLYKWWRTSDEEYFQAIKTATGVLGLNFALGAITGTLVEFGLVQAWPGTIFVIATFAFLPLTFELVAFAGEIVLLVLFIVTLRKVKPLASIGIMAAYLAMAAFSGAVIMTVNSWLNVPWGTQSLASNIYPFLPSYGPEAVDPIALLKLKLALVGQLLTAGNPASLIQNPKVASTIGLTLYDPWIAFESPYALASILHAVNAAMIFGISVGLVTYSFRFFKTRKVTYLKFIRAILPVLLVLMILQPTIIGDSMGKMVAAYQPTKFALMENINNTRTDPLVAFLGYGNPQRQVIGFDSFTDACQQLNNKTLGDLAHVVNITAGPVASLSLKQVCLTDVSASAANLASVSGAFYTKIASGIIALVALLALAALTFDFGIVSRISRRVFSRLGKERSTFLLSLIFLATVTMAAGLGWFVREVGRKPWTVYGLIYPEELITPVRIDSIVLGLFILAFVSMAIIGLYGMYYFATRPLEFTELLEKGAGVEK